MYHTIVFGFLPGLETVKNKKKYIYSQKIFSNCGFRIIVIGAYFISITKQILKRFRIFEVTCNRFKIKLKYFSRYTGHVTLL